MITKEIITIKKFINPEIKVGDVVKLTDGSGLIHVDQKKDFYITFSYPKYTYSDKTLKELPFKVIKTGIENVGSSTLLSLNTLYSVDIIIVHQDLVLYTCSQFVKQIN